MNKKFALGLMAMFAMTMVTAYLVNSFVITTDIYEPFDVEYAIIGDAGNWDGVTTCNTYNGTWMPQEDGAPVDVGGLFAGEGRMVCVKINNLGEGDVDYRFSGEVVDGSANFTLCNDAFGSTSVTGTAMGSNITIDGDSVIVAGDATPVNNCQIELSLERIATT
jgi:hypothetical protein